MDEDQAALRSRPAEDRVIAAKPKHGKQKRRGNDNERRFYHQKLEMFGTFDGLYEAVSFRLPGGSRYTPDFVYVDGFGQTHCVEVKGPYRLPSEGRALMAFRECRAKWPSMAWWWYRWNPKTHQYDLEHDKEGDD